MTGELDDIEEIDLTAEHPDGTSAKRIRIGKARAARSLHDKPRWLQHLRRYHSHKPVTLPEPKKR